MCYRQALNISVSNIEKSTALNDIATASMELFKLADQSEGSTSSAEGYLKEGLQSFDRAIIIGQSEGQTHLCNAMDEDYMESIGQLFNYLASKKIIKDRSQILDDIVTKIDYTQAKSRIFRETASTYFKGSVKALEENDYKTCLSLIRDCHQPLEEAKQCLTEKSPNKTDEEEIKELENSIFQQQCRAESFQARATGDAILEKSLKDSENLDMDAVYTAIDQYKKAIMLTKEIEVEMEAIALSRLGSLYKRICKDKLRAKQNFLKSLQLAETLKPKMFHQEEWYKLAADSMESYQKDYVVKEEEELAKEREPYLQELKEEIKALHEQNKEGNSGTISMLEFIYKTWPPKGENKKLIELSDDNKVLKKALRTAILHFHPDKQDDTHYGKKWCILAEEITKALNAHYEGFKNQTD